MKLFFLLLGYVIISIIIAQVTYNQVQPFWINYLISQLLHKLGP